VTDLTDLYAFPTPQRPGFLTVILDVYPAVKTTGHFSDRVSYAILVRQATLREGEQPGVETGEEVTIRCSFVTPRDDAAHHATCTTDGGLTTTVAYNQLNPAPPTDGLRLFAGQRADPFFFNATFAAVFASKGRYLKPRNQNLMKGVNTLAVVLEIDTTRLFPNSPPTLLAVAAESLTQDSPAEPVRRLDRLGRPEITNISLSAHGDETLLHDQYNADPTFALPEEHRAAYRARLASNLLLFDQADDHTDWTEHDRLALAELLVDDFLVVDLSKPCDKPAYFEIERSLLSHTSHQTCGGREPNEDVMDVIFGLSSGGIQGGPRRDGVDQPAHPASDQFPYLAPPDTSASGRTKAAIIHPSSPKAGSSEGE
jgi:hypothetical protein